MRRQIEILNTVESLLAMNDARIDVGYAADFLGQLLWASISSSDGWAVLEHGDPNVNGWALPPACFRVVEVGVSL
jgi:hypothetical protein